LGCNFALCTEINFRAEHTTDMSCKFRPKPICSFTQETYDVMLLPAPRQSAYHQQGSSRLSKPKTLPPLNHFDREEEEKCRQTLTPAVYASRPKLPVDTTGGNSTTSLCLNKKKSNSPDLLKCRSTTLTTSMRSFQGRGSSWKRTLTATQWWKSGAKPPDIWGGENTLSQYRQLYADSLQEFYSRPQFL
jgi:hypothetical protein